MLLACAHAGQQQWGTSSQLGQQPWRGRESQQQQWEQPSPFTTQQQQFGREREQIPSFGRESMYQQRPGVSSVYGGQQQQLKVWFPFDSSSPSHRALLRCSSANPLLSSARR